MKKIKNYKKPVIGISIDTGINLSYSKFPWYAIRIYYVNSILSANGIPLMLPSKPELANLKESLILVDKCLTIAQTPEEMIKEQDVQDYMKCAGKASRLLRSIGKRTGIPFNYSFLNDLQVQIAEDIKPIKTFTQFTGEVYGIR